MKNKKFIFVIIFLLITLSIGIGYAAVTRTLTIGGNIQTGVINIYLGMKEAEGLDEYYDGVTFSEQISGSTSEVLYSTAQITVSDLLYIGDKAYVKIKIVNSSESTNIVKVSISIDEAPLSTYFSFRTTFGDYASANGESLFSSTLVETYDLQMGDSIGCFVEVKLLKIPVEQKTGTFKVVLQYEIIG